MKKNSLIGLSLSQCTIDYLAGLIDWEWINCIFAGTRIHEPEIDLWVYSESKISPIIKDKREDTILFLKSLFECPGKLVQPRLHTESIRMPINGLMPCYKANTINWIHIDRWIDWNMYQRINQCCPFCGCINSNNGTMMLYLNHSELLCDNCHHHWKIPFDKEWMDYDKNDWMKAKY